MATLTIGYVGMTHLGLNSAAASAARGCNVVCFDPDEKLVEALTNGNLPVVEPDLPELINDHAKLIVFSNQTASLSACDIVYFAPDIATDDQGGSDLSRLEELMEIVDGTLCADCVEVILSQVPPGFTRQLMRPGRQLFYQVETLIFGRAIERAMYPERYMIGCDDPLLALPNVFREFLELYDCPILPMRFESAELAKISINCFLVAQVGTTNTLAEICESIGADWEEIAPALRLDARIGPKAYLRPGLGIAGGNLERDLTTIVKLGERFQTDVGIVRAEINNSRHRKLTAARVLRDHVLPSLSAPEISVWGLAYKENTHSIKNSPSLATLTEFPEITFRVHDPVVHIDDTGLDNIIGFEGELSAARGTDCLMILTPWEQYRSIDLTTLAGSLRGKWLIDPFGIINGKAARDAGLRYVMLGAPPID